MADAARAPSPPDPRTAAAQRQAEMTSKAKAGEAYMQLLQMIFAEKKKIGQDESHTRVEEGVSTAAVRRQYGGSTAAVGG